MTSKSVADDRPPEDMKLTDLERFLASLSWMTGSRQESASDPQQSWYLQRQNFDGRSMTKKGRILQSLPYLGWYKVVVEDQIGVIPCCKLSSVATSTIYGTIEKAVFPADTTVLVEIHPSNPWGYILGAIPSVLEDGNFNFGDWVVQGSHAGYREGYHSHYITKTDDEGGVQNFSSQMPLDSLLVDGGLTTTTGVSVHIDPFLTYLRVSEVCGVFGFYPSEKLLVAGHELEISSGAHQEEAQDDEGELSCYRGESPYSWEICGAPEPGLELLRPIEDDAVHKAQVYGKYEPTFDDQAPVFRYEEYGGYLGQGHIRQMAVPLPASSAVNRYSAQLDRLGVFREHIGLEGAWQVQSAHSVTIAKQCIIPIPVRLQPHDSATTSADSAENENYRFAGEFGEAEEHELHELTYQDPETTMVSVVGLMDSHTYMTNWASVLGFHYHKGDFKLPQASANKKLTTDQGPIDFYELQAGSLSPPTATDVKIDERYVAKFYKLLTMLHFTNDGNLVLRGGRGCQITFQDGDVMIDAPGNIFHRAGKSVVSLAGDDLILRARQCLDASANLGSVRIKSQKELHMLAGNGGTGCLLLESRGKAKTQEWPAEGGEKIQGNGVIVKTSGQFATMVGEIYLRTGGPKSNIPSGPIVLDAAEGNADIVQIAKSHTRFAKVDMIDNFNFAKVNIVNRYTGYTALLGGALEVNGLVKVRGGVNAKNGFATTDGHFQSQAGGPATKLLNPDLIRAPIDEIDSQHRLYKTEMSTYYDLRIDREYYGPKKIGSAQVQKEVSFGHRNTREYATAKLLIPQAYWQQLAQNSGAAVAWNEKIVLYQDKTETAPWPGKQKWKDDSIFCALPAAQHSMYDLDAGQAKDRADPYLAPKYGKLSKQVCDSSYLVINVPS